VEEFRDVNEFFVLIDSQKVYESDEFQMFATKIGFERLLAKGIVNVFFSYTSAYAISVSLERKEEESSLGSKATAAIISNGIQFSSTVTGDLASGGQENLLLAA
jgi:hypothetical protein